MALSGQAQNVAKPVQKPASDSLRRTFILKEALVQGAGLQSATRLNTPQSTERLTAKDFSAFASASIPEQLNRVAGLRMQQTCAVCGAAELQLNGLEGPYTSILIDSMPLVGSLAGIYATQGIPSLMLAGAEITRGQPGAALPSETIGGTVNLLTRPAGGVLPQARVLGGSFAEATLDVAVPLTTRWAVYGQGATRQRPSDRNKDGYYDLVKYTRGSLAVVGQMGGRRAQGKLYVRGYAERRLGGQTDYNRQQDRLQATRYGEAIDLYRGEALSRWQWHLRPQGAWRGYTLASAAWHKQQAAYGQNAYNGLQADATVQHGFYRKVGLWMLEAGPALRLLRYTDNTPTNRTEVTPAVYGQGTLAFAGWDVQPGLRLDATQTHGVQASPRVHVRYNAGSGLALRLGGGRAYRSVNVITEDHAALSGARKVIIPARLQPEIAYTSQAEATYDTTLGSARVSLVVTGWYNAFSNKILPDYETDPTSIIYRSAKERAVNQGITLQASLVAKGWTGRAGGTLIQYLRQPQGQPARAVLYAPRWQAQAEAGYQGTRLGATLRAIGLGPMALPLQTADTRPAKSPAYALLSAQASFKVSHHVTLLAQANNITDWRPRYAPLWRPSDPFDKTATAATGTFDTGYVYGPLHGRSFLIGVDVTLN